MADTLAPYGTPFPNSCLSAQDRFELYLSQLDAAAERQRAFRAAKVPIAEYRVERLAGQTMRLIDMEDAA